LAKAEIMTTIVYSAIGLIPLICMVLYATTRKTSGEGTMNRQGRLVQQALALLVRVSPILLLFLSYYLTALVIHWHKDVNNNSKIWEIYRISILRTIPFLSWFIGPLATITGVIGDILFYIQPDEKAKHATRKKCLQRLQYAMEYANTLPSASKVVVAHSWGTVVAVDHLFEHPAKVQLVTLGSPLEALCDRFLGMDINKLSLLTGWTNAYRYGDYVAGPLNLAPYVLDEIIGPGGHMNYWEDKALSAIILTALPPTHSAPPG
jgi:hypothetical protein